MCYKCQAVRGPKGNAPVTADAQAPVVRPVAEHASLYCPVCSERLAPQRCKLICKACGYYMSCSDYY
jgi:hypothetical protein